MRRSNSSRRVWRGLPRAERGAADVAKRRRSCACIDAIVAELQKLYALVYTLTAMRTLC